MSPLTVVELDELKAALMKFRVGKKAPRRAWAVVECIYRCRILEELARKYPTFSEEDRELAVANAIEQLILREVANSLPLHAAIGNYLLGCAKYRLYDIHRDDKKYNTVGLDSVIVSNKGDAYDVSVLTPIAIEKYNDEEAEKVRVAIIRQKYRIFLGNWRSMILELKGQQRLVAVVMDANLPDMCKPSEIAKILNGEGHGITVAQVSSSLKEIKSKLKSL